jgi:hypothetical protein
MTPRALRYQASRKWMEREILSGRPVGHRRQTLEVDPAELQPALSTRCQLLIDSAIYVDSLERFAVLDSGLDPEIGFGPDPKNLVAMDEPVIREVGVFPELSEPTSDVEQVISAWESWLADYCDVALGAIESLNTDPPRTGRTRDGRKAFWQKVDVSFGHSIEFSIEPAHGARAMRDALAGRAWWTRVHQCFAPESVVAAKEATTPTLLKAREWVTSPNPEQIAANYLQLTKKLFVAAKAHDLALRAEVPDFDAEMERWAEEAGSERLRLGLADGYRMNSRYLAERIAAEAPGFYAMPVKAATPGWARRANSPSEQALRLRRAIEATVARSAPLNLDGPPRVEIFDVIEPPVEIYIAEGGSGQFADLPKRSGWRWKADATGGTYGPGPEPFEAVVVHEWLGRFILIGAVGDEEGAGPPWVWAVPEIERFHSDGTVTPENPDEITHARAKRKPPGPIGGDDDIPF